MDQQLESFGRYWFFFLIFFLMFLAEPPRAKERKDNAKQDKARTSQKEQGKILAACTMHAMKSAL